MTVNQKRCIKVIVSTFLIIFFLVAFKPNYVNGAEETGIGFSYHNLIPKNQRTDGSYFDLLVKPKSEQELITEIRNESNKEIKIKISINDAKTNESGVIEYGPTSLKNVIDNPVKLSEILIGPSEVNLKKDEVKQIKFKLRMPEKEFNGVILGGIQLEKIQKAYSSKESLSIKNKYAYVFSVSLRENSKLEQYQISSGVSTYSENSKTVKVTVNNDSQEIIKNMKIATILTKKDSKQVLAESSSSNMKMAPKSTLEYPVSFENIEAGDYQTKTIVEANKKKWVLVEDFEVKEDYANDQEQLNPIEERKNNIPLLVVLLISIILGTLILYIALKMYYKK
ncbi:WxL protein peptidoglycan domain-containing protein [Vagococcus salmoninarum]|uniref:DUF916 domain-containing protein n=2 Tax=Vagococcus salmoninarum TaxID=2739 RepID=UPI003F9DF221